MKLNEALAILNSRKTGGVPRIHYLACGFEPLHLGTLFRARLIERLPGHDIEVLTGVYGDLPGNLARAADSAAVAAAAVLEWSDLDPRLGLRGGAGWSGATKADILNGIRQRFASLEFALERLALRMPVVVAPPSVPLPPIGNTIRAQQSMIELELEGEMAAFLARISRLPGVRVVRLPEIAGARLDPKMELFAGFPYTLSWASDLADALVTVLWPPAPMKGLITDLDETLWAGIVGEIGVEGITWHQEHHTQIHGLYQQMLAHLADCGVLLAVCSKNELSVVEAALARRDLLLQSDSFYPICANWQAKSQSVARILRAWNISEDSVVFIDDSPMELEEVSNAFPHMTCLLFRGKDPQRIWTLLGELRDLFGKPALLEEDRLRQASLRAAEQIQPMTESPTAPELLQGLQGTVTLDWRPDGRDQRPLELINKTNQFNLNGIRMGEGEWRQLLEKPEAIIAVVSYADKFGPLGKIAVLVGARVGDVIQVSHWVMSCRAFSRRIEYHILDRLFQRFPAGEVEFAFQNTERNAPLREFFRSLGMCTGGAGAPKIARTDFVARTGMLPHEVKEIS